MYSSDQVRSHVGRLSPVHGAAQPPAQDSVQYMLYDANDIEYLSYLYFYNRISTSYLFTAAPQVAVKTVLHCTVVQ